MSPSLAWYRLPSSEWLVRRSELRKRKMLADLISLCITLSSCIARSPYTVSMSTRHTWLSLKCTLRFFLSEIMRSRSPPSANCITKLYEGKANLKVKPIRYNYNDLLERLRLIVYEGFFVVNHVGMSDICQDSHFIDGVLFILIRLSTNLNLLKGIWLSIFYSFNLINARIGAISKFLQDHEVSQLCSTLILHLVWMTKVWAAFLLVWWTYTESVTNYLCRAILAVCVRIYVRLKFRLLRSSCVIYGTGL